MNDVSHTVYSIGPFETQYEHLGELCGDSRFWLKKEITAGRR